MKRAYSAMMAACLALRILAIDASAQATDACDGRNCETPPCGGSRSSAAPTFTPTDAMRQQVKMLSEDAFLALQQIPRGHRVGSHILTGGRSILVPDSDVIANAYRQKLRITVTPTRLILEMAFAPEPEVANSQPPEPFRIVMATDAATTIQALDPTELWELEQAVAKCTGEPPQ